MNAEMHREELIGTIKVWKCFCSSCLPSRSFHVWRCWTPTSWKSCHKVMPLFSPLSQLNDVSQRRGWGVGVKTRRTVNSSLWLIHFVWLRPVVHTEKDHGALISWIFRSPLPSWRTYFRSYTSFLFFLSSFRSSGAVEMIGTLGRQIPHPIEPFLRSLGVGWNKENVPDFSWS